KDNSSNSESLQDDRSQYIKDGLDDNFFTTFDKSSCSDQLTIIEELQIEEKEFEQIIVD
ncbi:28460_t:CDS:1, partial [Racocetra persica]